MLYKKHTVLIVDDDPATVEVLKKMNERLGVGGIFTAHNGFDAIAVAVEQKPSIIFLDLTMPGFDGIQTLKMLKSIDITKEIDVVMVSGSIDHKNFATALKHGATDFISKPFKSEQLEVKFSEIASKPDK